MPIINRNIILFVLLLNSYVSFSQEETINVNWDTHRKFYASWYNELRIVTENVNCDKIKVKGWNLEIIKDTTCKSCKHACNFYVRSLNKPDSVENNEPYEYRNLTISVGKKIVRREGFHVDKNIPLPWIKLNGYRVWDGMISHYFLDTAYCIPPYEFDDPYNKSVKFKVVFFVVELEKDGVLLYSDYVYGNAFPKAVKKFNRPGLKIIMKSIVVMDDQKRIYNLPDQSFTNLP